MGLDGDGAVLQDLGRIEAPEAHFQVGGGNEHPVLIGLQEKIAQNGHGAPAVHHSQGPAHSLQQGFPIDLHLHMFFS